jgi:patatin-like phospholipase/acyl hydrolase
MSKYKILSLDGGGSWSIIQVKALQDIYGVSASGHEVLKKFNLVVANSGGSLVLACLCLNLNLDQIAEILSNEKLRKKVFVKMPIYRRLLRTLKLGPKYFANKKREGLLSILPGVEIKMEDIPKLINPDSAENTHVLICAFEYDRERVFFYRSDSLVSDKNTN